MGQRNSPTFRERRRDSNPAMPRVLCSPRCPPHTTCGRRQGASPGCFPRAWGPGAGAAGAEQTWPFRRPPDGLAPARPSAANAGTAFVPPVAAEHPLGGQPWTRGRRQDGWAGRTQNLQVWPTRRADSPRCGGSQSPLCGGGLRRKGGVREVPAPSAQPAHPELPPGTGPRPSLATP